MIEILTLVLLSLQSLAPVAEGDASYYTVKSSGSQTASGERLRDWAYTCAMPGGTFGDHYLVVAENGRAVVCKLNDRGPHIEGRVVDLSKAAMRALDAKAGLVPVKVYHLGKNSHLKPGPVRIKG